MIFINRLEKKCFSNSNILAFCISVAIIFLLLVDLNATNIAIFTATTFTLSLKYPIVSIMSFICALAANNYLDNYTFLNAILFFMMLVSLFFASFLGHKKLVVFKDDLYIILVFTYSLVITLLNGTTNIFVLACSMLTIIMIRVMLNSQILNISEVIIAFCVMFIFSGIVGLKEDAFGLSFGVGSVSRFISSLGDPNFYSLLGIVCILGIINLTNLKLAVKSIVILVLSVFALMTFSKSLIFLLLVNLLYYLFNSKINKKNKVRILFFTTMTILIAGFIMQLYFDQNLLNNYLFRFSDESSGIGGIDDFTTGRYSIQRAALDYFANQDILSLMFGSGYIGTDKIFQSLRLSVMTTHSAYSQILLDFGIIGAILYTYMFLYGYIYADKSVRPILVTYIFAFLSLSWQFSVPNLLFYILLSHKKR